MKSEYVFNHMVAGIMILGMAGVMVSGMNQLLFLKLNHLAHPLGPVFWSSLTLLGDTLTSVAILLLVVRRRPDLVWSALMAGIMATLTVNLLKNGFNLPRPPRVLEPGTFYLIGPAHGYHSFPSGHNVTVFTLYGVIGFQYPKLFFRISFLIAAMLIGFSRIAVGVHWPADCLAGAAIGLFYANAGVYLYRRFAPGNGMTANAILTIFMILATLYFLVIYDSGYPDARILQTIISIITVLAGLLAVNHWNK
jgi:membrane-associated phospholipid phosphatase